MVLDPTQQSAFDSWLTTWGQPAQPTAPVMPAIPDIAPVPPPPPAPQQLATVPSVEEVAAAQMPVEFAQPELPMPAQVDQYGMNPDTAMVQPQPEPLPTIPFDPLAPQSWAPMEAQLAPVGHQRTSVGEGEQSLGVDEILKLTPEQQLLYQGEQAQKAEDFARQRQAEIQLADQQRADADLASYQKAKENASHVAAQIEADSAALANTKMEKYAPGIGDVLGIILGQFGAAATGGQNVGLQMVQHNIERDWERQKLEYGRKSDALGRKQNLYGQLREAGYSEYQAATVFRQAALQRSTQQLLTEMQNFDPKGTAAMKMASSVQQMQAMKAKAARDFVIDEEKQQLDREKNAREWIKTQDDHNAAQRKAMGGGAGVGDPPKTPEQWAAEGLVAPPITMNGREYDKWRARGGGKVGSDAKARKEEADAAKAEADAAASKDGYKITTPETGGDLVKKDGTPFVVMDAEERKKLRGTLAAASNIRKLADKMAELKKKYGGAMTSLGTDEAQEIRSLTSQIDFEVFKNYDLGAPSEGDKALAEGVRGGVDPTSFVKNATRGWQAFAEGAESKANTHLRAAGFDGPTLKFARASDLPAPKPTVSDELLSRAMKTPFAPVADPASPIDVANAASPAQSKANDSYKVDISSLSAHAQNAPNEQDRRAARAALEQLAQRHPLQAGRKFAAEALQALPGTAPVRER